MLSTIHHRLLVELFFVLLMICHTVGNVLLLEMILARYQNGLKIEQVYNTVFPCCGPKMASNTE
jgi:hypothetical protein